MDLNEIVQTIIVLQIKPTQYNFYSEKFCWKEQINC